METVGIPGVEIIRIGRWNGREYTGADLDAMVGAFHALRGVYNVPGKLGHNDEQQLLASDGLPAAGWVTNLYRKGSTLLADFADVPRKVADLIKANAYRSRSCEIWFNAAFEGTVYPAVLKAVSWLGEDAPAVSSLDDIVALYHDDQNREVTIVTLSDDSFDRIRSLVFGALCDSYPYLWDDECCCYPQGANLDGPSPSIRDLYADRVIVMDQDGDDFWMVPYSIDDAGMVTLGTPVPVKIEYVPTGQSAEAAAALASAADPTPRAAATPPPAPAANPAGAPPTSARASGTSQEGAETMTDAEIRALLGLKEDEDVKTALIRMRATQVELADHEAVKADLVAEKAKNAEYVRLEAEHQADTLVDQAIRDGKVLPKMRSWARSLCLSNQEAFTAYLESSPKLVEFGENGSSQSSEGAPEIGDAARTIGQKMGVPEERLADTRPLSERLAERRLAAAGVQ